MEDCNWAYTACILSTSVAGSATSTSRAASGSGAGGAGSAAASGACSDAICASCCVMDDWSRLYAACILSISARAGSAASPSPAPSGSEAGGGPSAAVSASRPARPTAAGRVPKAGRHAPGPHGPEGAPTPKSRSSMG
eukprot:3389250-Prymnesium_polylepis.1